MRIKDSIENWNIKEVEEWLRSLSINEEIIKSFSDNHIEGSVLVDITIEELKEDLGKHNKFFLLKGVKQLGPRKKIFENIQILKNELKKNDIIINETKTENEEKINNYKDEKEIIKENYKEEEKFEVKLEKEIKEKEIEEIKLEIFKNCLLISTDLTDDVKENLGIYVKRGIEILTTFNQEYKEIGNILFLN
jgi:hypothetical protein